MDNLLGQIEVTSNFLKAQGFNGAKVGIVIGTGLGAFIDLIEIENKVAYSDIPGFPSATVEFHKGQLIVGKVGSTKVIAMQGRLHYYERYSMQQITFPIRVLKQLGIGYLLLSNAAGGMNPVYNKGDLVLIDDPINELPENPLRGLNDPLFGNRFVDMSSPYSPYINEIFKHEAEGMGVRLHNGGVYVAVQGPNLETRAEYRHLRTIGADMVGMSTVPEVITANHIGLPCAAVSVITDECDPDNLQPVNIADIIQIAGQADGVLSKLFARVVGQL
jgi:purine-nucleoside phosphorylase